MEGKKKRGTNWLLVAIGLLAILAGIFIVVKFVIPSGNQTISSLSASLPDASAKQAGLDSQCPPNMPKFTFGEKVGSREWFDSLPKYPPEGATICAQTIEYVNELKKLGTYQGGILNGQRLALVDVMANHYSYSTVGNNSMVELLKRALMSPKYAKINGIPVKDTIWVTLPGYKVTKSETPQPICPTGDCFKPVNPKPLTTDAPPQPTAMNTPTPFVVDVPTIEMPTPQPQVATVERTLTPDEWLSLYKQAQAYEGVHCKHISNLPLQDLASQQAINEIWQYTTKLYWTNGQLGWYYWGHREDIYVPNYGEYPVYAVCGQPINMPDTSNIDGNGTAWKGGISVLNAPAQPDPQTGLVNVGGTYYVNVFGTWFAPAYPKPAAFAPTATAMPTMTPFANSGVLTVLDAINIRQNGLFAFWKAVRVQIPIAGNPYIEMDGASMRKYIDFTQFLGHINVDVMNKYLIPIQLEGCKDPHTLQYGGYKIATNGSQGDWCLVPGK